MLVYLYKHTYLYLYKTSIKQKLKYFCVLMLFKKVSYPRK